MRNIFTITLFICFFLSCKKSNTSTPDSDSRLDRPYCNDPEAVNYNWAFPGTPDNSICFYPTEVFSSAYAFNDSVYFKDGTFLYDTPLTLHLYALDKTKLVMTGFCGAGSTDTLWLTADRFYRAQLDTTIENGQALCNIKDTVTGNIIQSMSDSSTLKVNFTVVSDSDNVYFHRGTALKL
ncbi:MAG: hypothetical protein BGO69_13640 [Bacteroidetes bacterium 46-16]|nr:MAG: hypothetical protein BGO69_13640 [Bacteroidetes bacterium 46-16]